MIKNDTEIKTDNVCNFHYLNEMTGGNKQLSIEIIDAFLNQVPVELQTISDAITKKDYKTIKNYAHTMQSSVSIMGITLLAPILKEMENLAATGNEIEKINQLYYDIVSISIQAVEEIKKEKLNYI